MSSSPHDGGTAFYFAVAHAAHNNPRRTVRTQGLILEKELLSTQGGGGSVWASQPASNPGSGLALAPFGQQQQQHLPQYHTLISRDNKPIVRSTAWDEIQPQGQNYLLETEYVPLTSNNMVL